MNKNKTDEIGKQKRQISNLNELVSNCKKKIYWLFAWFGLLYFFSIIATICSYSNVEIKYDVVAGLAGVFVLPAIVIVLSIVSGAWVQHALFIYKTSTSTYVKILYVLLVITILLSAAFLLSLIIYISRN